MTGALRRLDGTYLLLAVMLTLFTLFCLNVIYEYPPVWPDETLFADTAYELAFHGRLATPAWGYVASGMMDRATWYTPLHFVLLAFVYRLSGFGILETRLLSLFFGLVAALTLFFITLKVSGGNKKTPLLATTLLLIDPVFIRGSIIGRGDVIAVAFMLLGFLCYLSQKNELKYLLAGFFTGLATLTHPMGGMGFIVLLILSSIEKNGIQARRKRLLYLGLPYLALMSVWGSYVLQDFTALGMANERAANQWSDLLFFNLFLKTYFYSAPAWLSNYFVFYLVLLSLMTLFLFFIRHYIENLRDIKAMSAGLFLAVSIVFYLFGPQKHSMWYNVYVQPFIYLSTGLIAGKNRPSAAGSLGDGAAALRHALPLSVAVLTLFYIAVDAHILSEAVNPGTDYFRFGSDINSLIPDGSSVLIASEPDPYFVLKDSGKNLYLYSFVHMGSYPMDEAYSRVLGEIDYFVFSGTPEKNFMSPYDSRTMDEFIRYNTTEYAAIGGDGGYSAVIYKTK